MTKKMNLSKMYHNDGVTQNIYLCLSKIIPVKCHM